MGLCVSCCPVSGALPKSAENHGFLCGRRLAIFQIGCLWDQRGSQLPQIGHGGEWTIAGHCAIAESSWR